MEGTMNDDLERVVPIGQLPDFEVAEGHPDVRGWEVRSADGRAIGEVDDLLIDTAAMKVRYLDVDLDDEVAPGGKDRHILLPIGYARLDREEDCIHVDELRSSDIAGLPMYNHEPLSREYENELRGRFDREHTGLHADPNFYASDLYDADRFYSPRRESKGNPLA